MALPKPFIPSQGAGSKFTMKNSLLLSMLLCSLYSMGQISTQSNTDGSITITPKGLQGKSNSSTDTSNVSFGPSALQKNTTGFYNTANGAYALSKNTGGFANTANGAHALSKNTSGNFNTANGTAALSDNTTGYYNTANGAYALSKNSIGSNNTAQGTQTLVNNTTGNSNTANGYNALFLNTTGSSNTANGYLALYKNTTGNSNTASGDSALIRNTIGFLNTAIGFQAGVANITGNSNTFVGNNANASGGALINATALGANAVVDASNKVRIGDTGVTVIEGQVAWSFPSDRRLKENIVYTPLLGLDFINRLQTVSYNYISDKTKVRHDGFIAQDIEQVMKELNVPFSGLKKSDTGMYSLAYSDFVMPLVNSVKELKQENEWLKSQLMTLIQKVNALETSKTEAKMSDSEAAKK